MTFTYIHLWCAIVAEKFKKLQPSFNASVYSSSSLSAGFNIIVNGLDDRRNVRVVSRVSKNSRKMSNIENAFFKQKSTDRTLNVLFQHPNSPLIKRHKTYIFHRVINIVNNWFRRYGQTKSLS